MLSPLTTFDSAFSTMTQPIGYRPLDQGDAKSGAEVSLEAASGVPTGRAIVGMNQFLGTSCQTYITCRTAELSQPTEMPDQIDSRLSDRVTSGVEWILGLIERP